MTRVDVSKVDVVTRGNGTPVFMADTITFLVDDKNNLWFSMKGPDGEPFAIAKVPEDRAAAALSQIMLDMGATVRNGRTFDA